MDLFRMEVETHAAALENGLVKLEAQPGDTAQIEPLMRAAHSIKGAARIVGLTQAVGLAHAMEDLFVAAQQNRLPVTPELVDHLLKGLDFFKRLSVVEPAQMPGWLAAQAEAMDRAQNALRGLLNRGPAPASAPAAAPLPMEAPAAAPAPAGGETAIPVTSETLSRLVGLAGESMVDSRRLETIARKLEQLKAGQKDLAALLEQLRELSASDQRRETVLTLAAGKMEHCGIALAGLADQFGDYALRTEGLAARLYHETVAVRMRPFSDGIRGYPRLVRDLGRELGKRLQLRVLGENTPVDRDILAKLDAPLTHLLRNACDHGIELPAERLAAGKPESGTITLEATHRAGMLCITLADDGRGIEIESVRQKVIERGLAAPDMAGRLSDAELMEFLFLPGFSTAVLVTELSGRGVGMDVVQVMVREVGGSVRVRSEAGRGTTLELLLPLTLSVIRALLVQIGGEPYALPLSRLDRVVRLPPEEVQRRDGRNVFTLDGREIGLVQASAVLGLETVAPDGEWPVVVVSDRSSRHGLIVEQLLGEKELVVRPLDPRLGRVPGIGAAAVLEDGAPVLILDAEDLVRGAEHALEERDTTAPPAGSPAAASAVKRLLVVDDSITVREVERRLLESRGYQVDTAVDGLDGWDHARTGRYDLIITDVDMPRLDGLELIGRLRDDPRWRDLPVLIVSYKDSEEDRRRGLEAGANEYLTKGSFRDESFARVVKNLLGEA
ncbi:MAG: hybrid sensor histidine kinase/response regulator [Verrucomicrobia bacterium]|nr:hybrid sensor histidine kinase/response regulator [Verrucomicrobiota bacterium]